MAAIGLKRRLLALEGAGGQGFAPWVRIIQNLGQTEEEALAVYEAEHGPLGDRNVINIILRKVV